MEWLRRPLWLIGKLLALAYIFAGGGLLAITILPLFAFFPGNQSEQAQSAIRVAFRLYLRALQFLHIVDIEIVNAEKFSTCAGKILIANHPSLLDVVILMAFIPRAQCIVKHQLWNHRLLGILMRKAQYIRNDLDPEQMLAACQASLDDSRTLIIFPEGTRTPPGHAPHFHRSFANIAILTKASIQTVFINCRPPFLYKGEKWWRVPPQKPQLHMFVGECLDGNSYLLYGQRSIAARRLVQALEEIYGKQIGNERP